MRISAPAPIERAGFLFTKTVPTIPQTPSIDKNNTFTVLFFITLTTCLI